MRGVLQTENAVQTFTHQAMLREAVVMVMKNLVMMLNVRIEVAAVEKVTYPQSSSQEISLIEPSVVKNRVDGAMIIETGIVNPRGSRLKNVIIGKKSKTTVLIRNHENHPSRGKFHKLNTSTIAGFSHPLKMPRRWKMEYWCNI